MIRPALRMLEIESSSTRLMLPLRVAITRYRASLLRLLTPIMALTRSLSVVNVETDFVEGVYEKLASVYDVFFGPSLHAGRVETIKRLGIQPEARVLEVGIGTGINTVLYPENCWVTGIDISSSMLEKAQERVERRRTRNVRLLQMDAAALDFPDESLFRLP